MLPTCNELPTFPPCQQAAQYRRRRARSVCQPTGSAIVPHAHAVPSPRNYSAGALATPTVAAALPPPSAAAAVGSNDALDANDAEPAHAQEMRPW